jgi:hypothetical protein
MATVIKADCIRADGGGMGVCALDEWPHEKAEQALSVGGYEPLGAVQYIPMPGTPRTHDLLHHPPGQYHSPGVVHWKTGGKGLAHPVSCE